MPLKSLLFSCLKFVSCWKRMWCKNFGRFHSKKHFRLGIYNLRLNPKILTEVIAKHYLIIPYYMNKFERTRCESECKKAWKIFGVRCTLKGMTLALFIWSHQSCSAQAGLPIEHRTLANNDIDTYHIPPVHIYLENRKCGLALHLEGKCFFAHVSCDCSIPHLQRCWLPFELLVSSRIPREACQKVMCTVRALFATLFSLNRLTQCCVCMQIDNMCLNSSC